MMESQKQKNLPVTGQEEQIKAAEELRRDGWGVIPPREYHVDFEEPFPSFWRVVSPYTMTSPERGYALFKGVEYVCRHSIPGEFVECGVWKGGSCMLIGLTLKYFGVQDRIIRLYDTFTGMTEPGDEDVIAWNGKPVKEKWDQEKRANGTPFASWAAGAGEVKDNLLKTGYPMDVFRFEQGDVAETLTSRPLPESIALLRLDTDWYASTALELEVLYPRLVPGGVLIIDDYGHFSGAKKAVDDYFSPAVSPTASPAASPSASRRILFNRIDYTGRIGVKPG